MDMISWFFVILAADLCAALIHGAIANYMKPKRGRPRKSRLAKIVPLRKVD